MILLLIVVIIVCMFFHLCKLCRAGDANAQMSLVNVAENSARYAVHHFFGKRSRRPQ
jgi:hypothetical protein